MSGISTGQQVESIRHITDRFNTKIICSGWGEKYQKIQRSTRRNPEARFPFGPRNQCCTVPPCEKIVQYFLIDKQTLIQPLCFRNLLQAQRHGFGIIDPHFFGFCRDSCLWSADKVGMHSQTSRHR